MSPTIRIDDDVYEMLKRKAEPFVDTPNSVLRRWLGLEEGSPTEDQALGGGAAGSVDEGPGPSQQPRSANARTRNRSGRRAGKKRSTPRAAAGTIAPLDAYELPILEVLSSHGGNLPASELIEKLESELSGVLQPADYEELPSGPIRWQNRAQFARLALAKSGDLRDDSPRGIWEISEQGRDRVSTP
jgi:hypothetical protein